MLNACQPASRSLIAAPGELSDASPASSSPILSCSLGMPTSVSLVNTASACADSISRPKLRHTQPIRTIDHNEPARDAHLAHLAVAKLDRRLARHNLINNQRQQVNRRRPSERHPVPIARHVLHLRVFSEQERIERLHEHSARVRVHIDHHPIGRTDHADIRRDPPLAVEPEALPAHKPPALERRKLLREHPVQEVHPVAPRNLHSRALGLIDQHTVGTKRRVLEFEQPERLHQLNARVRRAVGRKVSLSFKKLGTDR